MSDERRDPWWNMADAEFLDALRQAAIGGDAQAVYDQFWLESSHDWPADPPHPGEGDERSSMDNESIRQVWVARMDRTILLDPGAEVMVERFGNDLPTVAFRPHQGATWGPPHPTEER